MIGGKQNDCFCPECRQQKNKDDMSKLKVAKKYVCKACEYRHLQAGKRK